MADKIIEVGTVIKCKPNMKFLVELDNGHVVEAHLSGKLRMKKLQIVDGDNVKIAISPYDLNRGIIKERLPKQKGE